MIWLNNVRKTFISGTSEVVALDNISLHVSKGEWIVLKGASGSGKSTILSLIAGLSKPTLGEVLVADKAVSKLMDNLSASFRRHHIGFIFQKYHLIASLSVRDNIMVPLIPENLTPKELDAKALHVMQKFSIEHKANELVKNLSGGEQQRVAIARALINEPVILIADEPTANLDATLSASFINILRELKQEGVTIVVATHDPLFFELEGVDRCIEVKNGVILS